MTQTVARIGIVTVSDRASRGEYQDLGGPAIHAWLTRALTSPWEAVARVIPDEREQVEATLKELCDTHGLLSGGDDRWYRPGAARCDAGGDRGRHR